MAATIRGHQGTFKLYADGSLVDVQQVTNVQTNMDSSFSRAFYVGNAIGEGDQTVEGWSGSFEMEVKDDKIELFFDALINNNLNGIGVSDYTFLVTENYPDGTTSTYLFTDCQFKMGRKASGLNEKVTKNVDFQAGFRQRI